MGTLKDSCSWGTSRQLRLLLSGNVVRAVIRFPSLRGTTGAMGRGGGIALLIVLMVVLIVVVDVIFLRDHFWLRLLVNVSIVAVAGVIYLVFLRR